MFGFNKTKYTSLTDEHLMRLVNTGDRKAFETLYDRYFAKLVWFANGFVGNKQQAEDVVQDTFIKLMDAPDRFNAEKKFSTWIYVITANLCKQQLRNAKNRARIIAENFSADLFIAADHEKITDRQLLARKIEAMYPALTMKERSIYTLRFEQELPIKEIAEILNLPEGSVKSCIYYLLKKFAAHLKDFSYET